MKRNWSRILALVLTLYLPVLGLAGEMTRSNIENTVARDIFRKTPFPYQKIWELVDADDGEGLRAYLTAHQEKLTEDDFMVVWESTRGGLGWYAHSHKGEHIYCYAARAKKTKVGKVLIDLKYTPKRCFATGDYRDWGDLERTARKYFPRLHKPTEKQFSQHMIPWLSVNYKLACYALETQQIGFKGSPDEIWFAVEGGCDEAFVLYRNDQLKFPRDYQPLTAPGWLALAKTRPELVSTPNFQKYLLQRIAAQKDSWFEIEQLKQLLLPESETK